MKTKPFLTLDDIRRMAAAAEAEAGANQWAVTLAIVDDGGHLLWLQRGDGAAPISALIAPAKARTAALGRRESKVYEDMINQGRASFLSAPTLEGMLEGGVPVMVDGHCIGAVGVSGVKSAEDAQIARAGIAALGAGGTGRGDHHPGPACAGPLQSGGLPANTAAQRNSVNGFPPDSAHEQPCESPKGDCPATCGVELGARFLRSHCLAARPAPRSARSRRRHHLPRYLDRRTRPHRR
jgi:glc operon protein GlcG